MCDDFFKPGKEQTSTMLFIKDRATKPESFGDKTGAIEWDCTIINVFYKLEHKNPI